MHSLLGVASLIGFSIGVIDMQALVKLIVLVISIPLTVSSISAMKIADDINSSVNSESTYQQSISTHYAAEQVDSDSMPENPRVELPDEVSSNIPADATVIAKDLTVSKDGTVQDIETGQEVNDPKIVGTEDKPADPLVKTDGQKFIPIDVESVREAVEQQSSNKTNAITAMNTQNDFSTVRSAVSIEQQIRGNIRQSALQNNTYGAYWGSYNDKPAFFEYNGNPYIQDAKGVIDVSEHQGYIDWQRAKASGVEGAIIRISYGWDNGYDKWALRNIQECQRLGIPFGIYSYSYSYDANTARAEAQDIVNLMRQAGVYPNTLKYPVFYDLEKWSWKGHQVPTNPDVYASIVDTWMNIVRGAGYDGQVYSYTSYINTALNRSSIHNRIGWVASYGSRVGFNTSLNKRGWQYTSTGSVAGINGYVDLNAFGVKSYIPEVELMWVIREEDIAVGATIDYNKPVEYKWMSYNVNTQSWKDITGWIGANWAGWADNAGTYWLHVEARDAATKKKINEKTIAFAYVPGYHRINGTYAGYRKDGILLGVSSANPKAQYKVKIYDTKAKAWIAQFSGQWNIWKPVKGIYWTHFELYTSDGRLVETKTYPFGV